MIEGTNGEQVEPLVFQETDFCLDPGNGSPQLVNLFLGVFLLILCLPKKVNLYTEFLLELGLVVRHLVRGNVNGTSHCLVWSSACMCSSSW